ncbi:MAG: hypothetical protein PHU24_01220 [Sphaerochaetaceae bacterium]|jgi:hypothetical protein|nr:hypothetical protein [Sphaerochaetaceae bacterium]NLO61786.1 hypothetical protein [Spirochaetales bacterium]MDD2405058.1 hypothetical protein [Sphaerochaetaceae bacterium]MDD3669698.1 hypothetical protein [Sphaerochaetaceae bacterium]MDD4258609.1 hypothetical protein [Sphaerochaetaceae bacterium]
MKATLAPIFFKRDRTAKFSNQLQHIKNELSEYVRLLEPIALGEPIDEQADAVVFPEILGEAYEHSDVFKSLGKPILILTSEFMTISMWDWEIMDFLRGKGVQVLAPYNKQQSEIICRSLALKRKMRQTTFLIFQDNPGEGFQPEIFKCFYWWGKECTELLHEKFGLSIERRSLIELGKVEQSISDDDARSEIATWDFPMSERLSDEMKMGAAKYYLAVKQSMKGRNDIGGIGSNCLNESRFSSSTPCIAWNLFYERQKLLWACEGDTLSLATKYLLHHALDVPVMMSNIYPVLMGMAALKHEGIPSFPEILDEPEHHILLAHCGYFGLAPESFCSSWKACPPVLKIVDKKAHALDVRFPVGPITMAKIDTTMQKIMVIEGELKGYVQYAGSDCRNGAIVKVNNGPKLMQDIYSHHQILLTGHHKTSIAFIANIFGLTVETL